MPTETPSILAFSGSSRTDSFNHKLVQVAALGAERDGATVTRLNLRDYPLPLFDEDLEREEGPPEMLTALRKIFIDHHGFLISSPEYNSSVSPLLKNTIDWLSRPLKEEPPMAAFRNKVVGLMAASPGQLGGLRGLVHLRSILGNIGVIVLPKQMAIGGAFGAFNDDGALQNEKQQEAILGIGQEVSRVSKKLNAA